MIEESKKKKKIEMRAQGGKNRRGCVVSKLKDLNENKSM